MAQLTGLFLIATLLFVHLSTKAQPMHRGRPLDVDEVPFPAAGQASTVFSLTALFGAYYGIFLVLGVYAVAGLSIGSVLALVAIRASAINAQEKRYEQYLFNRLNRLSDFLPFVVPLAVTQLLFAVSELLILRRMLAAGFGVAEIHATLMAICIAAIGYLYCLIGGYNGVFRTDIVQLVFILVMCTALLVHFIGSGGQIDPSAAAVRLRGIHPGHWYAEAIPVPVLQHCFDFLVGLPMGMTFLLASPDTWKRVFIVTKRDSRRRSLAILIAAGAFPFALITPMVLLAKPLSPGTINPMFILEAIAANDALMAAILLGLISSFLSAFNSAFISSLHLAVLQARKSKKRKNELAIVRFLAGGLFVALSLFFLVLFQMPNPYALGNVLLGPYAVAGASVLGLRGGNRAVKPQLLLALWAITMTAWATYLIVSVNDWGIASTHEANTIPPGIALFVITLFFLTVVGQKEPSLGSV
jgi:Na+/pantothenate symporter